MVDRVASEGGGLVHSSTGFLVVLVSGGFWVQVVVGGSQWSWMVPLAPLDGAGVGTFCSKRTLSTGQRDGASDEGAGG